MQSASVRRIPRSTGPWCTYGGAPRSVRRQLRRRSRTVPRPTIRLARRRPVLALPATTASQALPYPFAPGLTLGLVHQDIGDASTSMESRDVHLLDLIVNDHDETPDGSVDGRHGRVADPLCRPSPERTLSSRIDQLLWDEPEVAILPTEEPDLSDVIRILRARLAQRCGGTVRGHCLILASVRRGLRVFTADDVRKLKALTKVRWDGRSRRRPLTWSCWSCTGVGHHLDSKLVVSQPARRAPVS